MYYPTVRDGIKWIKIVRPYSSFGAKAGRTKEHVSFGARLLLNHREGTPNPWLCHCRASSVRRKRRIMADIGVV